MRVKEIMTPGVECIRPHDSIARAAERMRDLDVGSLPVCGDLDRLVGMVTDRDITVRAIADGSPPTTNVLDVMTPEIVYCYDDQEVGEAADLMERRQIRRVAVLNRDKRLVGIVSLGDIAVKSANEHLSAEALECVSQPAEPAR